MVHEFLDLDGIDERVDQGAILDKAEVRRLTGRIRGLQEIVALAHQVRLAQKVYFRDRTPDALQAAKVLETQLDAKLKGWKKALEGQLTLFET